MAQWDIESAQFKFSHIVTKSEHNLTHCLYVLDDI